MNTPLDTKKFFESEIDSLLSPIAEKCERKCKEKNYPFALFAIIKDEQGLNFMSSYSSHLIPSGLQPSTMAHLGCLISAHQDVSQKESQ